MTNIRLPTTRRAIVLPVFASAEPLEQLRRACDPLAHRLPPHIPLIFPFESGIPLERLTEHVRKVAARTAVFPIECQGITGHLDTYLFLNVKRGNDELIALHDLLYTGPLLPYTSYQQTYFPHVTVGRLPDRQTFHDALMVARRISDRFVAEAREVIIYRIETPGEHIVESRVALGEAR